MEIRELDEIASKIITTYYQNDLKLFFHYLDEGVLWIGPRQGQMITGKRAMEDVWAREKNDLRFQVLDLHLMTEQVSRDAFSQIAFFKVSTLFPDQTLQVHDQRIVFIWKERRIRENTVFRIRTLLVSNAVKQSEGDTIYAVHDDGTAGDAIRYILPPGADSTVSIHTGRSKSTYLPVSSIYRIESTDLGTHTIFYTREGQLKCLDSIRVLSEKMEGVLLKCHARHIVNPMYVRSIRRFCLTMSDGTEIPIPEKKYTAFRRRFDNWMIEADVNRRMLLQEFRS